MHFSVTPDKTGLCFSPWEIRPGIPVRVDYSYVAVEEVSWYSEDSVTITVSGTPYISSIKSYYNIPEDNITIAGGTVTIEPIHRGVIDLRLFYKIDVSETITSRGAITETNSDYYNDWFYDDRGVPTPYTVVPLELPANEMTYKPEDFTVTINTPIKGISILDGDIWESTSRGTVKTIDRTDDYGFSRNMFRKGILQVEVPMACKIEPAIRYVVTNGSKSSKIVEIDIQDWIDDSTLDCRGILWHRDFLYILTNTGLHRFERWGQLDRPEHSWSSIVGNDLTYTANDQFLVTNGLGFKVYQIRHDYFHIDRDLSVIRTRERQPDLRIT